jgi:hypothetical protein
VIFDRSTPHSSTWSAIGSCRTNACYGVIEVKSNLDKTQLLKACRLIERVKRLPKTAFHAGQTPRRARTVYGNTYGEYCPTVGMIFAFDRSSARGISRGPIPRLAWWTRSPSEDLGCYPYRRANQGRTFCFRSRCA